MYNLANGVESWKFDNNVFGPPSGLHWRSFEWSDLIFFLHVLFNLFPTLPENCNVQYASLLLHPRPSALTPSVRRRIHLSDLGPFFPQFEFFVLHPPIPILPSSFSHG